MDIHVERKNQDELQRVCGKDFENPKLILDKLR